MIPHPAAVVGGAVTGLGVGLLVREMWPARPRLAAVLARLDDPPLAAPVPGVAGRDLRVAVGAWLAPRLVGIRWLAPPRDDLLLLRRPVEVFYTQKAVMAGYGLALPAALTAVLGLLGISLPAQLSVLGCLALAVAMWFAPDLVVHGEAAEARAEFREAVGAYLDLVALVRAADGGPAEALERAAAVSSTWPFGRIATALDHARYAGQTPWQALAELAGKLQIPELRDLADIVLLAGQDGAAIHGALVRKAEALRAQQVAAAKTAANTQTEKMTLPGAVLLLGFLLLFGFPVFARVFAS